MRAFSKILMVAGIVLGIVLVGLLVGWFGTKGLDQPELPDPLPPPGPIASPAPTHEPPATNRTPVLRPGSNPRSPRIALNADPTGADPADTNTAAASWEDKLDDILGAEAEESVKAKQIMALFPILPEDSQVEAAQHLSNLVADEDYAALGKHLADPKLPESVLDVLMADLLNRPNTMKLPMLLEVARAPDHVKAPEAKDLLELYLDEDYGNDWAKWQQQMEKWLKDNPE